MQAEDWVYNCWLWPSKACHLWQRRFSFKRAPPRCRNTSQLMIGHLISAALWCECGAPCLNVSLVNAGAHYCALAAEASVFDLGLRQCHCQVGFIAVNELFFSSLFSTLGWKCTQSHAVNKERKVSHCWVIADVSNPHWETFNFQLCLAFLVSNHYWDRSSFCSWEPVWIFSAHLSPHS